MFKQIISSFIVGGLLAVLTQGYMNFSAGVLGAQSPLVVPMTLLLIGLTGGVLFIVGIYEKIEKLGYFGAILPLCGLVAAVAGVFTGTKMETGSSGAATKSALNLVLFVLGLGTILSMLIGAIAFYTV
ncbi:SpoVA/SpoVAEb family sporulation membrane protein [Desulfitobacterium chlororespirans]|uniref:SpoVA protein n=1 Tax=Desulfitobacterium chlororespirans DSM 11544 TaxID=1121395 RepID=A0A1M7SHL6_9FIRM|nr:SpoVA/SpoVAEb family sporulation membrane protein [Desulfitobacterium chlororespirans]SHN57852.1 SpoVA protein [Desulfitobacterium chlororespirans DSM 11544]